jgi:hypothetical protein
MRGLFEVVAIVVSLEYKKVAVPDLPWWLEEYSFAGGNAAARTKGDAAGAFTRPDAHDLRASQDVVDLLQAGKIEVQTQGSGIRTVGLRVRRLVPFSLTVRVPVGTFFVSGNTSSQNMVSTDETTVRLTSDSWEDVAVPAACANRPKHVPGANDSFTVQRSPHQEELARLMPVLDGANVDYPTRQAAIWIVTDNARYVDLGILVSRPRGSISGGTRTIREFQAARAMQICEQAGIPIKRKAIWRDRLPIARALNDGDLKRWLEEHQ